MKTKTQNTIGKNLREIVKGLSSYGNGLVFSLCLLTAASFLLPLLATVISSTAVKMITAQVSIRRFILLMALLSALYVSVSIGKSMGETFYYKRLSMAKVRQFTLPLCEKILTTDYGNMESGENQKKFRAAVHSIGGNSGPEKLMHLIPELVINLLGLFSYSFLIIRVSPLILAVLFVMTVINAGMNQYARSYQQKHWPEKWNEICRASYVYRRSVGSEYGKDIRIYGIKKWFHEVFQDITRKEVRWHIKVELRYLIPHLSDSLFLCLRDVIAYGILVGMFMDGLMDATGFTFYLGIITGFSTWMNDLVGAFSSIARANLELDQYQEALRIPDRANHGKGLDIKKLKTPLEITFSHICFRYPGADCDALHDLSFTIQAGEKLALVGANGAGKTTIVKLLCGFYQPDSGQIRINGHCVSDFNLEEYQKLIGVAFQDIMTLAFTISENISGVPRQDGDETKIESSLRAAGLWEKVDNFPDKAQAFLGTALSSEGVGLSGGEMQKLIFARALYKDAPLLILDEPTSALDPLAESELYQNYCGLTRDKTSVFISHRLSSTRFCDRIFFLSEGAIQESGSHEELMQKGGAYAQMYEIQSHYYREEQLNNERKEAAFE